MKIYIDNPITFESLDVQDIGELSRLSSTSCIWSKTEPGWCCWGYGRMYCLDTIEVSNV